MHKLAHSLHAAAQWLLYNDCLFRTRNLYEYVMFHDRDEFVNFVGLKPKKVDLLSTFNQHFADKDVAGVTYWGALYHTHCHMEEVRHRIPEFLGAVWGSHARTPDGVRSVRRGCGAASPLMLRGNQPVCAEC